MIEHNVSVVDPKSLQDSQNDHDSQFILEVVFLGFPNAGKSTLLNALLNSNISIVTHKRNTTTHIMTGIYTQDHIQLILVDTPGLPITKGEFQQYYIKALTAISTCHMVMLIIDVHQKNIKYLSSVVQEIRSSQPNIQINIILNKIDTIDKVLLLPIIQFWHDQIIPNHVFLISAKKKDGLDDLIQYFKSQAQQHPFLYDKNQKTNASHKTLFCDVMRKHILLQIHEEIPYHVIVQIENYEQGDKIDRVSCLLLIQNYRYRSILLGYKGLTLKTILQHARSELEGMLGKKLYINTFIKVKK